MTNELPKWIAEPTNLTASQMVVPWVDAHGNRHSKHIDLNKLVTKDDNFKPEMC